MMTVRDREAGIEIGIGRIGLIETGEISGREVIRLMMIETNVVGPRVEFRLDALNSLHIDHVYQITAINYNVTIRNIA